MERTNLTKDELVLVINSVQRQIIVLDKTEKQDAELMPKYRLLLKRQYRRTPTQCLFMGDKSQKRMPSIYYNLKIHS